MATTAHIPNQGEEPTARVAAVNNARQSWIRKLIDLSRRNNLLYYRPLKTGTLDLSNADAELMAHLLSGAAPVSVNKLLPNGHDDLPLSALRDIARRALANAEEKGLKTLFVALGMATWPASDGGRPTDAPILLLPVQLDTKGSQSFSLTRTGTVQVNLVLLHVLDTQYGIKVTSDDLIPHLTGDDEGEPFDARPLYDQLRQRAADIPGFDVKSCAILGNFSFQKMAMVKDVQERAAELAAHDIIAAIAGDNGARNAVSQSQQDIDPRELDRVLPENEFIVLDADSSQQCGIAAVLAGQSAVIHGPPGTGKSQTIVNLVASLAAAGKRILFVAEKRAALEVVLRRLREVGLAHLAIDLHGADLAPKRVMQQIAEALDKLRNAGLVDCEKIHQQLLDRRARLNEHVRRLHTPRQPTGKSLYEMQGRLLRLSQKVAASTRWRGEQLNQITPSVAQQVRDLLADAAGFEHLFLRTASSRWTRAKLMDGSDVARALDVVSRLETDTLPAFLVSLQAIVQETGLAWPTSIRGAKDLAALITDVQTTLSMYDSMIYQQNLASLLRDLSPGKSGGLASVWAWCTNSAFRRSRALINGFRTAAKAPIAIIFRELSSVLTQAQQWKSLAKGGSLPCTVNNYGRHHKAFEALFRDAASLAAFLPDTANDESSVDGLANLVHELIADTATPHELPKLRTIENGLQKCGVGKLVDEIRDGKLPSGTWPLTFDSAWFLSALDAASEADIEIRGFKGSVHGRYVDEFIHLDEERIGLAADRVRRAHAVHAIAAMNANPAQEQLIRAEAAKSRRHVPLRRVFAQAAEVLTADCPCWMASPLSVSQLLDGGKQYFDYVVFDEASQVLPEDAVPAILRGNKVVVAGDNKQLPPTTFFAAAEEEEFVADEEAGASEGFESLLDMMIPFVRSCYLDWHYRSRDEALINFSNHYIYKDRLVTFPGPGGPPAIGHELVSQEPGIDGQEESSTPEVRRVVEQVLRHAREHPMQTLGVITMGIKHMNRVQAALDRELEKHPELEEFFDPNITERFFVKNLERVQGDERDAIIISIGYGKDRGGNLPLRFGPLLSEGGRRRLNVAVTRARQKLTVVSSFSHTDIDLARVRPGSGVELLRNYLEYVASRGKRLGDGNLTSIPLNDFETDVFDALTAKGLKLVPQFGASQFRIDMVASHPRKPGRLVLAIECDGATYHSSCTARDRDRLRQQQLENLGWRFHRIWSTDWFMRKAEEVERTIRSFETAVDHADKLDSAQLTNGTGGNIEPSPQPNCNGAERKRGSRPPIPIRPSIAEYTTAELVELVRWVCSDGQLRTDDEIISDMVSAMSFSRRGARIEARIRMAIPLGRERSQG